MSRGVVRAITGIGASNYATKASAVRFCFMQVNPTANKGVGVVSRENPTAGPVYWFDRIEAFQTKETPIN